MTHFMSNEQEPADKQNPPTQESSAPHKLYHAMRNGTLYRSTDGVNWEIETDSGIPALPEGASRVTSPAKGRSKKQ